MPPRIVHVISNLGTGGAETMLVRLIEHDAGRAGDHAVISLLSGGALAPRIRALGVELHELGAARSFGSSLLLPGLARALGACRADVVQAWMYHANVAASAARILMRSKPPILWNIRQTVQRLSNNRLRTQAVILAGAALGRSPRGIVYNSEVSARQHERLFYPAARRIIIENGFDLSRFPARATARPRLIDELGLGEDAFLVGRVARKAPQKDDATLFAAFAEIAEHDARAHLVLIGKGMSATDPELARLAAACGAADRVHFLGERLDVVELSPGFDVAVSSSAHSEGFSNVVAEAMAARVPAVATDVGDALKVVGDPARVVPAGDPKAIAAAVLRLAALDPDARLALGERDRGRIAEHFDIAVIAGRYRDLWEGAAREG